MRARPPASTRRDGRRPWAGSRVARALLAVVRALLVVVAFDLSGLFAIAGDLTGHDDADVTGCCSDCPAEQTGKECPPGCPSCHCSHGAALSAHAPPPLLAERSPVADVVYAPSGAGAPRAPFANGVYRPPRIVRAST